MLVLFPTDGIFLVLYFLEFKLWSCHPLIHVFNVITGCFKVSCSIICMGNKDLVFYLQIFWYKQITGANEFLFNWFQELQSWSDCLLGFLALHSCMDYGNVLPCVATLCAEIIDIWLTWFCGIMIWQKFVSLVFLIGWLRT